MSNKIYRGDTIVIEHDAWINSQLSIARYYGGIIINNKGYRVARDGNLVLGILLKLYNIYGYKHLLNAFVKCCSVDKSYTTANEINNYLRLHIQP